MNKKFWTLIVTGAVLASGFAATGCAAQRKIEQAITATTAAETTAETTAETEAAVTDPAVPAKDYDSADETAPEADNATEYNTQACYGSTIPGTPDDSTKKAGKNTAKKTAGKKTTATKAGKTTKKTTKSSVNNERAIKLSEHERKDRIGKAGSCQEGCSPEEC